MKLLKMISKWRNQIQRKYHHPRDYAESRNRDLIGMHFLRLETLSMALGWWASQKRMEVNFWWCIIAPAKCIKQRVGKMNWASWMSRYTDFIIHLMSRTASKTFVMERLKVFSIIIPHPSMSNPTMSHEIRKKNPIALISPLSLLHLHHRNWGHSSLAKKSILSPSKAASSLDSSHYKINVNISWVPWKKVAGLMRL